MKFHKTVLLCHSTITCLFWHLLCNLHLKYEDLFIFKGRILSHYPSLSLNFSAPHPSVTLFCPSMSHLSTPFFTLQFTTPPLCSLTSWLQLQKLVPFLFLSYLRNLFALEHKALFRPLKMATADNPISLFRGSKTKTINYQAGSDRYDQGQGLFPRDRISPLAFDFQLFPNAIHVRHSAQKELSRLYHSIKGA